MVKHYVSGQNNKGREKSARIAVKEWKYTHNKTVDDTHTYTLVIPQYKQSEDIIVLLLYMFAVVLYLLLTSYLSVVVTLKKQKQFTFSSICFLAQIESNRVMINFFLYIKHLLSTLPTKRFECNILLENNKRARKAGHNNY